MSDINNVNAIANFTLTFLNSPKAQKALIYNNMLNKVAVRVAVRLTYTPEDESSIPKPVTVSQDELRKYITIHYVDSGIECYTLFDDKGTGHGPIGYDTNPLGYKNPDRINFDRAISYEAAYSADSETVPAPMDTSDSEYSYATFWINARELIGPHGEKGNSNGHTYGIYAKFTNSVKVSNNDTKIAPLFITCKPQINYKLPENWVVPPSVGFDRNKLILCHPSISVTKINTSTGAHEDVSGDVSSYNTHIRTASNYTIVKATLISKIYNPGAETYYIDDYKAIFARSNSNGANWDNNYFWFREYPVKHSRYGFRSGTKFYARFDNIWVSKRYQIYFSEDFSLDISSNASPSLQFYRLDSRIKEDDLKDGAGNNYIDTPCKIHVVDEYGNQGEVTLVLDGDAAGISIGN